MVLASFSNIKNSSTSPPSTGLASIGLEFMFHDENFEAASFRGGPPVREAYEYIPAGFMAVFQAFPEANPCADNMPELPCIL
jgi:hypothetical protein